MKKRLLKVSCLILAICCCIGAFSGCGRIFRLSTTEAPTSEPSPTPAGDGTIVLTEAELQEIYDATEGRTLPIGAWIPTPDAARDAADIEARYADMAAAGINFAVCSDEWSSDTWTTNVLNAAEKAGVGIYLHTIPSVGTDYMVNYVSRFKDHPALIGIYLKDEPDYDGIDELAPFAEKIRAAVSEDLIVTANLFPTYAMSFSEYTPYVQHYMETIQPDTLWFDHYPYSSGSTADPTTLVALTKNLDIIREEAQKNNVDAYSFIQNSSWSGFRVPTEGELRFLVNFNLMFGMRGITYYTWAGSGSITSSAVDTNGGKTDTYYAIQGINADLEAMKGVYMDYEQDGFIFHNSHIRKNSLVYRDRAHETYGPLTEVVSDGQVVIGCFKKDNAVGFYVVNYNSAEDGDTQVTLNFDGGNEYLVWGADGLESGGKATSVTFDLRPGDAKFVTLEEGSVVKDAE